MNCTICGGMGGWYEDVGLEYCYPWENCSYCKGTGKQTISQWFWENVPAWFVEWYADTFCKES